jgi:hypothetical protein
MGKDLNRPVNCGATGRVVHRLFASCAARVLRLRTVERRRGGAIGGSSSGAKLLQWLESYSNEVRPNENCIH